MHTHFIILDKHIINPFAHRLQKTTYNIVFMKTTYATTREAGAAAKNDQQQMYMSITHNISKANI